MKKLKIAIIQGLYDGKNQELSRQVCEDQAMLELCSPVVYDAGQEDAALRDLSQGNVDALVLAPNSNTAKLPKGSIELILTEKSCIMPLVAEPTAEDIVQLRDILERDLDCRSPRIAIVQDTAMQNPELPTQVTTEQGINTYGPYTSEQIISEELACHFDGIIVVGKDKAKAQSLAEELAKEAPVRYFAGQDAIVTGICRPAKTDDSEEGLADVSWLTHPFYAASDIIRNRIAYDEARLNPLPKLFHDKREERKKNEQGQAAQANNNNDNTEKAS